MNYAQIVEIFASPFNYTGATIDIGNGFVVAQTSSANGSSLRIQTAKEHFVREDQDLLITVLREEDIITIVDLNSLDWRGKSHIRRFYLRDIEGFAFE